MEETENGGFELKSGHLYVAERSFGKETILVDKGDLAQLLQDAKFWWEYMAGRLFVCDQCSYFNSTAQAVQDHSDREHDCRYQTYESVDKHGARRLRVRTVKCHSRAPLEGKPATKAWEGLRR